MFVTHLSPLDHVVLDDLLRAFFVRSAVHERLVSVRIVVGQHQLARFLPVITVQVIWTAVTARASDCHVAQCGRITQAPHAVSVKVRHISACKNNNSDDDDINYEIINSLDYNLLRPLVIYKIIGIYYIVVYAYMMGTCLIY